MTWTITPDPSASMDGISVERAVVTTFAPFSRSTSTTAAPTPFVAAVTSARRLESPSSTPNKNHHGCRIGAHGR